MMTSEKYYHVEPVGAVYINKNSRSRHIRLRVKPDGKVFVSMPELESERKAINFVKTKTDWILKQQNNIRAGLTVFTEECGFRTRFHQLKVVRVDHKNVSSMVGNGIIQINVPKDIDVQQANIQDFIRRIIVKILRFEAKVFLPKRLNELAEVHGFRYSNVYVKHVKSRWGSCSAVNNINLNIHLMRLPERLCDYIILHELAHTVEKNHGKQFWQLLEKVCPGAKSLDREMKNYHVDIY